MKPAKFFPISIYLLWLTLLYNSFVLIQQEEYPIITYLPTVFFILLTSYIYFKYKNYISVLLTGLLLVAFTFDLLPLDALNTTFRNTTSIASLSVSTPKINPTAFIYLLIFIIVNFTLLKFLFNKMIEFVDEKKTNK